MPGRSGGHNKLFDSPAKVVKGIDIDDMPWFNDTQLWPFQRIYNYIKEYCKRHHIVSSQHESPHIRNIAEQYYGWQLASIEMMKASPHDALKVNKLLSETAKRYANIWRSFQALGIVGVIEDELAGVELVRDNSDENFSAYDFNNGAIEDDDDEKI